MKTVTILQADWLHTPFVQGIVTALGADNIKFVGGAVRDTLLGRAVADIDAATRHKPQQTIKLLNAAGIKTIPTGLKHGTITAVLGRKTVEITTLRVDVETDGRHAEVAFTKDWQEDAARRDFTFNALYAAPDGTVFDPFGGLDDLKAGKVRFIGDATARIEEDALRIMRFFRFFGRYGQGEPDVAAVAACTDKRQMLAQLSIERIRDELLKIMALPQQQLPLGPMGKCGLLQEIYGSEFQAARIEAFLEGEDRSGAEINALLRFYFLAPSSLGAAGIAKKFKLSGEDRKFLLSFDRLQRQPAPQTENELHRAIYSFGAAAVRARAVGLSNELYKQTVGVCDSWQAPELPVRGRDLLALGWEPGPEMGACLARLESQWLESGFRLSRDQLLDLVD